MPRAHRLASRLDRDALRRGGSSARLLGALRGGLGFSDRRRRTQLGQWSSIGAAILIEVGGSAWLSAEVDKSILRKAAATAAQSNSDPALVATITAGTSIQALNAAVAAKNASNAAAGL